MNGTAIPPPGLADQATAGSQPGRRRPRSWTEILLVIVACCAFLVFIAGMYALILEPVGLHMIDPPDDKAIDRMLTVVGRQLNFVSLFVACFSLFMAVAGIFINRHFNEFRERQKEFGDKQKTLEEMEKTLTPAFANVEKIRADIFATFAEFKTQSEQADRQLEDSTKDLSQKMTVFNAEFVLSAILPDPTSTQQIPVETTYVLHQFQKLIEEVFPDEKRPRQTT